MSARRLNRTEIDLMLSLAVRGGMTRPVSLTRRERAFVVPLWRRRIVEVWYRQSAEDGPSFQGPFGALTQSGARLALAIREKRAAFAPAPRGFSGAEEG